MIWFGHTTKMCLMMLLCVGSGQALSHLFGKKCPDGVSRVSGPAHGAISQSSETVAANQVPQPALEDFFPHIVVTAGTL